MLPLRKLFVLACLLVPALTSADGIRVEYDGDRYQYHVGDVVRMTISSDNAATLKNTTYEWMQDGVSLGVANPIDLTKGSVTVETKANRPGSILLKVGANSADNKPIRVWGGAAVDADQIKPAAARPEDFDPFWKDQLSALAKVDPNPKVEEAPKVKVPPGVSYFKVTLDNVDHTHAYAQLAMPSKPGKYPAVLILQGAGIYALPPANVIDRAKDGWLALNVIAHDLPIDLPNTDGQKLEQTTMKDYFLQGCTSRETSYFRLMILRDYQAAQYLTSRPEWDGRVFLVTGRSQGGLQSMAIAGLHPKVSAVIAGSIGGCDSLGREANRATGFPNWAARAAGASAEDVKKIMETSRYFDPVNFAPRVAAPALISIGLTDVTAYATGIFAMYNALPGPKQLIVGPHAGHADVSDRLPPFGESITAWTDALRDGQPVPTTH